MLSAVASPLAATSLNSDGEDAGDEDVGDGDGDGDGKYDHDGTHLRSHGSGAALVTHPSAMPLYWSDDGDGEAFYDGFDKKGWCIYIWYLWKGKSKNGHLAPHIWPQKSGEV